MGSNAGDTECHIWNIDTDVLVYSSEGDKFPAVSKEEMACQVTLEKGQAEDPTHDECVEQFVDMPDRGNQLAITFDFIEELVESSLLNDPIGPYPAPNLDL